jgi:hypothetical protein
VREPEHLMLARPRYRRVEQAGDADPVRQSTFDGALTRLGARKASEIVMLTWRLLQACRASRSDGQSQRRGGPADRRRVKLIRWVTRGSVRPPADDFEMLRLFLMTLLPQLGGLVLMVARR